MTTNGQSGYKGIILAGGSGTRLYPVTHGVCKSLLPIYDKPMIYYPLSTLMLAGIREILVISTPQDPPRFEQLLGDGARFGITLQYAIQERAEGIAQAFLIGSKFIGSSCCALVLGTTSSMDTISPRPCRRPARGRPERESLPTRLMIRSATGWLSSIRRHGPEPGREAESPEITLCGDRLYFYDNEVVEIAQSLKPSARGELEITDVNKHTFNAHVNVEVMGEAWLARYGNSRIDVGSCAFHSDHRIAAGSDGVVPGGDRLPLRLHYRRAIGNPG